MNIIFTLCSNNYLAQALVLADSVKLFQPGWHFIIGLVDRRNNEIDYTSFGCEVLDASVVEPGIASLALKFNIIELNTCLKPAFFLHLFVGRNAERIMYMDPDLRLFHSLVPVEDELGTNDIVLTPHILTMIPQDGKKPDEPLFLNYGLYNLGFMALKNSAQVLIFLAWWKDRTYENGYDKPAKGLFTDQLWINLVPLYFSKVAISRNTGLNMAPWNLHERTLKFHEGVFLVNDAVPLVFYHFSGFNPEVDRIHRDYDRYHFEDRPDLVHLYKIYRTELLNKEFRQFRNLRSYYDDLRKATLKVTALTDTAKPPFLFRTIRFARNLLPKRLRQVAGKLARA